MIDFSSLGLAVNAALFTGGAFVVWLAGTKITHFADRIAHRSGLGEAAAGVLILAGITSLPEIATSFTAARSGDAALAVNNLLGSIALQIALLAIADLLFDKRALTAIVPDPVVMLQGALHICLLAVVATAVVAPDRLVLGAGAWSWGLLGGAIYAIAKITEARDHEAWIVPDDSPIAERKRPPDIDESAAALAVKTAVGALAILLAGVLVARTGEALAAQTGLGSSFMGVAFVALATSLPECSTVFAAMRRRLYTMAISDILGTNIFNVALLFGVDIVATGAPIFNRVSTFSAIAAALGILLCGLFLMGLTERRDRTILRMGVDSILVLIAYAGGMGLLYVLRSAQ